MPTISDVFSVKSSSLSSRKAGRKKYLCSTSLQHPELSTLANFQCQEKIQYVVISQTCLIELEYAVSNLLFVNTYFNESVILHGVLLGMLTQEHGLFHS